VSTTARLEEASRAPRERGCLATALSAACQAGDRPLTLSVTPRCSGDPEDSRSQRRFRRTLVKRSDIRDAERLPSTSAPWSSFRRSIEREPATDFAVLPPRFRLPTLVRPLSLSRWRARPEAAPGAIHPWPPRAARRLSISATDTTHEHNCAIVQTPPTTPVVAHTRGCLSFHEPRSAERSAGGRASRHSQPRFHGPGPAAAYAGAGSLRHDRSQWRLNPNPIDSDTSCREVVAMQVGAACTAGTPRTERPAYEPADEPRSRRTRP
jgi:hypothetical protein